MGDIKNIEGVASIGIGLINTHRCRAAFIQVINYVGDIENIDVAAVIGIPGHIATAG